MSFEDRRGRFAWCCGMCLWLGGRQFSGHYVTQPICHSARDGVDGSVGTVDANTFLGEPEQRGLLAVDQSKGLYPTEYDGMVSDNNRVSVLNCLIGDCSSQIDRQQR